MRPALVAAVLIVSGCIGAGDFQLTVTADHPVVQVTRGTPPHASVRADVTFELGSHSPGDKTVVVPKADLLVGDRVGATVNMDRPTTFDGTLSPGEDATVTVRGEVTGTLVDVDALCAPEATTVIALYYGWTPAEATQLVRTSAVQPSCM